MRLIDFHRRHDGETMLLVGNGPNLRETPPEYFDYPSIGMNTIFFYDGWKPDYYIAVDAGMYEEYFHLVMKAYPDIPKFCPSDLTVWKGDDLLYFKPNRTTVTVPGLPASSQRALVDGLGFANSMTAAMNMAIHMGAKTLLLIGVEQKPGYGNLTPHFWGDDPQMPPGQTDEHWNNGYIGIRRGNPGVRVLNISVNTYVPEDVLPRDDWRNWTVKETA